ncbi:hypothetical protein KBC31_04025 [Candidatus Saccharibacteria bacterium]|nr:hypothetical protein [Candidatus Saccharibacteria bacterium]
MKKNQSKLMVAAAALTITGASLFGINGVSAANNSNSESLVDRLTTKFELNKDEVKKVVTEFKEEKSVEHDAKRLEDLQAKVDDGTITAEQKTKLEAKFKEMGAAGDAIKDSDKTDEEKHDAMKAQRDEFKQWAEDNGISLDKIRPEGKERGHHRHGGVGPGGPDGGEVDMKGEEG